jgi:parvulin-like peptidyl-prolyl isomerase
MNREKIITRLKTLPAFNNAVKDETIASAIYNFIKKNNLLVTKESADTYENNLREILNIKSEDELNNFLKDSGITKDKWKYFTDKEASVKYIEDIIITDELIIRYYNDHKERFKIIYADKYITKDKPDAERLISAPVYSNEINYDIKDEMIIRGDLPVDIESEIFSAEEGDIIGPLKEGDQYVIYKIKKIKQASPDNLTKSKIRHGLFFLWLSSLLTSSE